MDLTAVHYIFGVILIFFVSQLVIRLIRYYFKFPLPAFMVDMIDNPLRRKIQPPTEMPLRHGIELGMMVLEVGPGSGTYSNETARLIGNKGKLITVDIQFEVIQRVNNRSINEDIKNINGIIADVHQLPFSTGAFNAIYMIAVIGEIPKPDKAMHEFYRILTPSGTLAFSEILVDPDYPLARTLEKWATQANFRLKKKLGNIFVYTLLFEKARPKTLVDQSANSAKKVFS